MDIRKRRRLFKTSLSSLPLYSTATATKLLSLRSLFLSFSSFLFLLLFSNLRVFPTSFRPTRIVPAFSHLSSSVSNSVQDLTLTIHNTTTTTTTTKAAHSFTPELRIQARILLPYTLLVFLNKRPSNHFLNLNYATQGIDCVYHHTLLRSSHNNDFPGERLAFHPALSADDYDEFRWVVRCPLPPLNYSSAVGLEWHLGGSHGTAGAVAGEVPRWDWAAYEAVVDGDTAVVFVKGFNLRPDRKSDPKQFRCRFELGKKFSKKGEREKNSVVTTTAISAAQEIIRCPLPETLKTSMKKSGAIGVAIERPRSHQLVPSVARLNENQFRRNRGHKYQLCACTMVWNQATALREWVMYHAWLGVERWFIYDNNSDDGLKDEVEKLNSENYDVTRHAWPWIKSQEAGFSQCVLRARRECSWVAFFDVDEFYYFPLSRHQRGNNTASNSNSTSSNNGGALRALVAEYSMEPGIGEIRTKCHSFGPSGLEARPAQGVMVGYTCRLQRPERHKSIIRPEAVDDSLLNSVHHFRLREGFVFQDVPEGRFLINHYKYQVWDAFKAKFSRRVSTYVADWQDNQNEGSRDRAPGLGKEAIQPPDWKRWYCQVWDMGLRDLVVANLADPDTGLLPWEISVSL